jgi:hypothetical protein
MDRCRILEIVAGLAAVGFVSLLVWEDFIRGQSVPQGRQLRVAYYTTALTVLGCVLVLAVRHC